MEYVLITGATSGIGYEMAKVFATKGYPLILVGRSEKKLKQTKAYLEKRLRAKNVISICQDLSHKNAAKCIYQTVRKLGIRVTILVNNAGIGYAGEFEKASEEALSSLIEVNMTQLTLMTRYFAIEMKKLGRGKILNVASTGAYSPGAYIAVYYATKAYVLSLSEALYEELKSYGVLVSTLCPGATLTNFQKASGRADTKLAMSPKVVAEKAYCGLMKNKKIIVPGLRNQFMIHLPKKVAIKVIKRYQKSTLLKH